MFSCTQVSFLKSVMPTIELVPIACLYPNEATPLRHRTLVRRLDETLLNHRLDTQGWGVSRSLALPSLGPRGAGQAVGRFLWARKLVTPCGLAVLVNQAANPVWSRHRGIHVWRRVCASLLHPSAADSR